MEKKSKKRSKIPKPIKVKKEKTEESRTLQSMAFYIDDRLELVKQIFGTLKPKTITNLAPEFLKKKKLEKIEELCLTELLCISKKRLLSIINGTKCPTDTESSSDSDVEEQEEHVSLEEISSESSIEAESTKKGKKKKAGAKANDKTEEKKKDEGEGGVISVLELLELQARARAIRSQLALEPVTKIEVDADDEASKIKIKASEKPDDTGPNSRKSKHPKTNVISSTDNNNVPNSSQDCSVSSSKDKEPSEFINNMKETNGEVIAPSSKSARKVKIKRNYRKSQAQDNNVAKDVIDKEMETKQEPKSPSPDVIPIVAEPETLCISDSSDDEASMQKRKKLEESTENSVGTSVNAEPDKTASNKEDSEIEDGEISDEDHDSDKDNSNQILLKNDKNQSPNGSIDSEMKITEEVEDKDLSPKTCESNTNNSPKELKEIETNNKGKSPSLDEIAAHLEDSSNSRISLNDDTSQSSNNDDNNDDIISIEGSDIETEITKEELENDSKKKTKNLRDKGTAQSSGEDSKDHHDIEESFRERYLNSSKVTKVLTASRLGKRVRDKIKKSKNETNQAKKEPEKEEIKAPFQSKHEDGSVEQYKELLELDSK